MYTSTAAPVASKDLLAIDQFANLSSATIRNEMTLAEKCNLIEKPHTQVQFEFLQLLVILNYNQNISQW